MERIDRYEALAPELNALLARGVVANALPERESLEREIAAAELWTERLEGGLLLLHRTPDVQRVRFLLSDPAALSLWQPDRLSGLELPFRRGDARFPQLAETLEGSGWSLALRRIRMSRKPAPVPPVPALEYRTDADAARDALELLYETYSPATACLPRLEDLEADLAEGRMLCCPAGMLRWRRKGKTTEMRHLAVRPASRGQGVAGTLVGAFLSREHAGISRVWVGEDNAAAIRLYRRYGYTEDSWTSLVLLHP